MSTFEPVRVKSSRDTLRKSSASNVDDALKLQERATSKQSRERQSFALISSVRESAEYSSSNNSSLVGSLLGKGHFAING